MFITDVVQTDRQVDESALNVSKLGADQREIYSLKFSSGGRKHFDKISIPPSMGSGYKNNQNKVVHSDHLMTHLQLPFYPRYLISCKSMHYFFFVEFREILYAMA